MPYIGNLLTTSWNERDDINQLLQEYNNASHVIDQLEPDLELFSSPEDELVLNAPNYKSYTRNYTGRIGVSYMVSNHFSTYIGIRINYVRHNVDMAGRLMMERPSTGQRWDIDEYFKNVRAKWEEFSATSDGQIKELADNCAQRCSQLSGIFKNAELDLSSKRMNGIGIVPVIGIDYNYGKLNIGAKYEFVSHVYVSDGYKSFNIPSVLAVGVEAAWPTNFKLAVGSNIHFKTDKTYGSEASYKYGEAIEGYANNAMKSKTSFNVSGSITYTGIKKLEISAGATFHRMGTTLCYGLFDSNTPNFKTYSYSAGCAYCINDNLKLNFGYTLDHTNTQMMEAFNGVPSIYRIKNKSNIGLGLNVAI